MRLTRAVTHIRLCDANHAKIAALDALAADYLRLCQQYTTRFCAEAAPDKYAAPCFDSPLSQRWQRAAIQQAAGIAQSWRSNRDAAYQDHLDLLADYQETPEGEPPGWKEWNAPVLKEPVIQAHVNVALLQPSEGSDFDYWLLLAAPVHPGEGPARLLAGETGGLPSAGARGQGAQLQHGAGAQSGWLVADAQLRRAGTRCHARRRAGRRRGCGHRQLPHHLHRPAVRDLQWQARRAPPAGPRDAPPQGEAARLPQEEGRHAPALDPQHEAGAARPPGDQPRRQRPLSRPPRRAGRLRAPECAGDALQGPTHECVPVRVYASNLAHIPAQLAWGAAKRGIRARTVTSAYSSQGCHRCHHAARANRPDQQTFCCVVCGHATHPDLNAAQNLASRLHDRELAACPDREAIRALLERRHQEWLQQQQRLAVVQPPAQLSRQRA